MSAASWVAWVRVWLVFVGGLRIRVQPFSRSGGYRVFRRRFSIYVEVSFWSYGCSLAGSIKFKTAVMTSSQKPTFNPKTRDPPLSFYYCSCKFGSMSLALHLSCINCGQNLPRPLPYHLAFSATLLILIYMQIQRGPFQETARCQCLNCCQ